MTAPLLPVGQFRFDLTVTEEIVLPPYKGFAFRGVFGTVLRELACVLPEEQCPNCPSDTPAATPICLRLHQPKGLTVSDVSATFRDRTSSTPPWVINGFFIGTTP